MIHESPIGRLITQEGWGGGGWEWRKEGRLISGKLYQVYTLIMYTLWL